MVDKFLLIILFSIAFYSLLGIDWSKIFLKSKSHLALLLCILLAMTLSYCTFSFIRFINFLWQ